LHGARPGGSGAPTCAFNDQGVAMLSSVSLVAAAELSEHEEWRGQQRRIRATGTSLSM
jgi:hypothetical protein